MPKINKCYNYPYRIYVVEIRGHNTVRLLEYRCQAVVGPQSETPFFAGSTGVPTNEGTLATYCNTSSDVCRMTICDGYIRF